MTTRDRTERHLLASIRKAKTGKTAEPIQPVVEAQQPPTTGQPAAAIPSERAVPPAAYRGSEARSLSARPPRLARLTLLPWGPQPQCPPSEGRLTVNGVPPRMPLSRRGAL